MAGCPSGQREQTVNLPASPTLVRTQHLPHKVERSLTRPFDRSQSPAACPAETGRARRNCGCSCPICAPGATCRLSACRVPNPVQVSCSVPGTASAYTFEQHRHAVASPPNRQCGITCGPEPGGDSCVPESIGNFPQGRCSFLRSKRSSTGSVEHSEVGAVGDWSVVRPAKEPTVAVRGAELVR
jgi:hypothetical protein